MRKVSIEYFIKHPHSIDIFQNNLRGTDDGILLYIANIGIIGMMVGTM